jgi:hypothetical protein
VKMPVVFAAAAVAALFALPGSAQSAERKADGLRNSDQIEVSSRRRHRYVYRAWRPRYAYRPYYHRPYYRPYSYYRPAYYGGPYYAYAPYSYYAPGPFLSVGPFGFGFGVGW